MSTRERSQPPGQSQPRAEQVFFEDPALDRMMGVLLALATEHGVLLDRVRVLETVLAQNGVLAPGALEAAAAGAADGGNPDMAEFAHALLRPLLGVQQATGATGRFSLADRRSA